MQKHPSRKENREVAFFEQLEQRLLLSTVDYDLVLIVDGTEWGEGEKDTAVTIADGETSFEVHIYANVPDIDFGAGNWGGLLQGNFDLVDSSGVPGRIEAVQGVGGPPLFLSDGNWDSTSPVVGMTNYKGAADIDGNDVLGQVNAFGPGDFHANWNTVGAGPDVWTLICTGNFNILVTQGDVVTLSLVPGSLVGQLVYGLTGDGEYPTETSGDSITLTLGTAGPAPEIMVEDGSETEVYDATTTPINIGSADRGAAGPSMEFTIRNVGTTEILNLTTPFADLPHFIVSDPLVTALDPGEETTFTVTLNTNEVGTWSEQLQFGNNDPDENPFNFFVSGTVNAIPQEITVLDGGDADVSDGTPEVDAVYIGFAEENEAGPDMIFTIRNDGDFDLTLDAEFDDLLHFTVGNPGATTLQAGETTTFTVTLITTALGQWTEEISFGNNDVDEDPFNFYVTGLVGLPSPEITVLDGSDDNVADNGLAPDAIDIGSVQNGAVGPEVTFTIRNDGTGDLTLDAVFSNLAHFTVGNPGATTLLAGEETTFTVTLITTETGLWTEEISFGNNDDNENPFNFHVIGAVLAAAPEIVVLDDGAGDIADGETTPFDIGSAVHFAGGPSRTFTIRNDGQQTLTLTSPFVDLAHFIVGEPGTTSLAASETTTFTITLLTGEYGTFTEVVSFGNNDDDENPFNFTVTGTVIPLPPEIVVLDGENDDVSDGEVFPLYIGNAQLGWTGPDMTFTIRNDGEQNLDLTTPFADAAHFEVSDPGVTTLTPGQQTTFTVTLLTHEEGDFIEVISFANNDGDENPFSFTVSGWVSLLVQFIPFSEEFSGDEPDGWTGWEYYSSNSNGRIEVADGELRMYDAAEHPAGLGPLNEAILHLNLIGESGVWVALDHTSAYDEDHALPADFIGHENGDGVSFSADGTTWYLLTDLTDSFTGRWYDLDAAVQSAGIAYSSDFRIKFQQFDNQPWGDDGRAFDNIRVQTVGTGDATVQYEIRVNGSADAVIIEEPGPFTVEVYANVPNAEVTSGVYGGLLHSSYSLEDSSGIIGLADPVTASPTWNSISYNDMTNNAGLVNTGGYDVLGQEDYFTSAQWGDNWDTVGAGPGVWTLISSGTFDPVVYEDDTITLTVVPGDAGDMLVYGPNSPEYALSALGDSIDVTLAGRIFDFGGKVKAEFYDGDGDLVTISLSGPGDGRLYLNGSKIVLDGTSGKSTLSIKVRKLGVGDGRFA
ncbi:MAG: choice-of-anchor D domain-containing protein, partial [Phycisphaerae bacterium]|nr:choice-of-anchor D domain-containing protein [Phycisphaerae bacterium]